MKTKSHNKLGMHDVAFVVFMAVFSMCFFPGCAKVEEAQPEPTLSGKVTNLKVLGDKELNSNVAENGLVYHLCIEVIEKDDNKTTHTVVANSRAFPDLVFVEVGDNVQFRFYNRDRDGYDYRYQMLDVLKLVDKTKKRGEQ